MPDDVNVDPALSHPDTDTPPGPAPVDDRGVAAERRRADALKRELDALKAAQAERERAEAEQRGEFQRLYETEKAAREKLAAEHAKAAERLAAVEAREAEQRKARVEALPQDLRDVLDGLTPEQVDAKLPKLEALAVKPPQVQRPVDDLARSGGTGGDPDALSQAEAEWVAAQRWIPANASTRVKREAYRKAHPAKA